MNIHEKYINRCIELARNGLGRTWPNPLVGSVIVHKGHIIGEGWHRRAGDAHAEVNAINAVKDQAMLKEAAIYVSLEPCSHYGKTPPCSNLIIDSGIKKIIIGTIDPFGEVRGKGIKKLLDAGCQVTVGVLEKACQDLNRRFFTYHTQRRPYIILKWAESRDGFIAPFEHKEASRRPVWISNSISRQLVHKWRAEEQAILVGTRTALKDNPRLNTRHWSGADPIRIVIDRKRTIPLESHLFDRSVKTIVLTEENSRDEGENLVFEHLSFSQNFREKFCDLLYDHEIQSLLVEGGTFTLQALIDQGLWDEARIFRGPAALEEGIPAPVISGRVESCLDIAGDKLQILRND